MGGGRRSETADANTYPTPQKHQENVHEKLQLCGRREPCAAVTTVYVDHLIEGNNWFATNIEQGQNPDEIIEDGDSRDNIHMFNHLRKERTENVVIDDWSRFLQNYKCSRIYDSIGCE